jgi:vacuolar-type H+-ATPase subunit H
VSPEGPASRRQIEDTTAARLAEIVAAAETAAKQVIDEAEAEARERLADATEEADRIVGERLDRLAGLTEELDLQAEALKRGAEALRAALADARAELGGGDGEPADVSRRADGPAPEPQRPTGPSLTVVGGVDPRDAEPFTGSHDGGEDRFAPPPRADASPSPEPDFEPASNGTPAGARLLATQMAVSGSTREEIEQRLRSGFAISDTTSILDAILGPER